nr:uncharacterized protein LOC109173367 [Ipomoea batatas]
MVDDQPREIVDYTPAETYTGQPDDNTEQPDTRSPEAITNPQPTSEEESESDNDQDQFLMASQNPFTIFFTSEDRLSLARKIVQGISDFNPAACAKIALTFALNPSLMDDLTMKDSRRIMELAKLCSEVPWNLPESAVLDPEQSAPPTHALAEPRTTDAAPAALAVAAQSAPAPTIVAAQSAPAPTIVAAQSAHAPTDVADKSAPASADVAGQSATASADVAARSATAPSDVAPMPQVFAQVINDFFDRTEVDVQFSPDYDLIASSHSNSHYRTWPKRDTKKPGESVSSTRSRVSVDFAVVSARVLTTQSIIKSLKSTVVQMEKVLLEDQMLL